MPHFQINSHSEVLSIRTSSYPLLKNYLFIWLHRVLVAAHRPLSSCGKWGPGFTGSVGAAQGLSCSMQNVGSYQTWACRALADRPLTTGWRRKSYCFNNVTLTLLLISGGSVPGLSPLNPGVGLCGCLSLQKCDGTDLYVIPSHLICRFPSHPPFGNHKFDFKICESISVF